MRNPFSAGRWVCGPDFFGRSDLVRELSGTVESCDWVIGKRRVGKTSLLRHMEWYANQEGAAWFALFWDVQGSFDKQGLKESLEDALEDSQAQFEELWDGLGLVVDDNKQVHQMLRSLARTVGSQNRSLLLLIDEAEEFLSIGKHDLETLARLRKFFQNTPRVRTVLCSTPRLEQLHKALDEQTSPFLHGFNAHFLGDFTREETDSLLSQGFQDESIREEIYMVAEGNPFQTQLLAKQTFECGDVEAATLELEANPSLQAVLEVNFDLLNEGEQNLLKDIHCGKCYLDQFDSVVESPLLNKLERMGYVKRDPESVLSVGSHFLRKWLQNRLDAKPGFRSAHATDSDVTPQHQHQVLKQILFIYSFFLENANQGRMLVNMDRAFKISSIDGSLYPDLDQSEFEPLKAPIPAWQAAIQETARFLSGMVREDVSWSVYRFHQVVQQMGEGSQENEFLDLMMLMAEEAELL